MDLHCSPYDSPTDSGGEADGLDRGIGGLIMASTSSEKFSRPGADRRADDLRDVGARDCSGIDLDLDDRAYLTPPERHAMRAGHISQAG